VIVSLILSAGESSRMGEPKALLSWNGKTFLAHVAQAAFDAGIKNRIVVIGAHAAEIAPEIKRLNLESVVNKNWQLGMGSSIKTGVKWIQKKYPDCTGILIQLCDQPEIDGEDLSQLLCHAPDRITCAKYADTPGVPALFPQILFSKLLEIQDQEGAKKLLLKNNPVTVEMPHAQADVDTPEQLQQLRSSGRTS
jgi:molybdenum cofactor cytidylyltransferase